MSDQGDDGTDQASIRPVSSLRSLFEKKTSSDNGSGTPPSFLAPSPLAGPSHGGDGSQIPMRASLDIPRASSPWSKREVVVSPQSKDNQGPPLPPPPRRPNSRILQRPLSTTSLSTPRSPPMLAIHSPTSPPKFSHSANTQRPQSFSSRPMMPIGGAPSSSHVVPVSATNVYKPPVTEPHRDAADPKVSTPVGRLTRNIIDDGSPRLPTKSGPPLINRAEKPKVPAKPSSKFSQAKLEPLEPTVSNQISPFSTPPSSDESLGADIPKLSGPPEGIVPREGGQRPKNTGVIHPKIFRSTHEGQQTSGEAVPFRRGQNDARASSFNQTPDVFQAEPEGPPGLPPRRWQNQSHVSSGDGEVQRERSLVSGISPLPDRSKKSQGDSGTTTEFLPPPRRVSMPISHSVPNRGVVEAPRPLSQYQESNTAPASNQKIEQESGLSSYSPPATDYPDVSNTNRRPPNIRSGAGKIDTNYDSRLVDICGRYVATTGHITRVWDVNTGQLTANFNHGEREIRVTSLAFKPALKANDESLDLWLGTNHGEIQEISIPTQRLLIAKSGAHERREIVKIHRYQNSMWTLDDGGRLCVWPGDDTGLPDLQRDPIPYLVARGYSFSLVIHDTLWLATGREIRIYRPSSIYPAKIAILQEHLGQPGVGAVTSGATIGNQLDRVYFGHVDGKVTVYSTEDFTCLGVVSVSNYKIYCLAGAGSYLWAGYSTGSAYVYDTRVQPWVVRKDWLAHDGPVLNIQVDQSSLWKQGVLRVVSLGADNALRFWDGTLEVDWLENDMVERDIEYCTFRELTALVISWNAGAATPTHLRHDERDSRFFQDMFRAAPSPDLLVFGFQELVDLEDKKLTAKTLFKGSKKKDPSEQDHMSRQYRAWRDYLVRCIEDSMPFNEPYQLLHTASMVGLFSCVFIKTSQHSQVRNSSSVEIKRGMGGLHGNKGALVFRFILDDSSVCLVNCHLAAGQTQTVNRNNDITNILEATTFPVEHRSSTTSNNFVGGGDGSMILDHEICILNGDLNYRIDTMGRDTVVKAINANNLSKLLERDQLLVSRRRNPGFRLRAFIECPINFAPTYKYDVGSDRYDTSEKRRAPAWCDRILYRGPGKIKQMDYRRHELRVSDHRPVSGRFKMRVKAIHAEKRTTVRQESEVRFQKAKEILATEAKIQYLRDVLGVSPNEAKRLV